MRSAIRSEMSRRDLVIARGLQECDDPAMLVTAAKEAVSRGADLVELPARLVDARVVAALDAVGIGCVGCASEQAQVASVSEAGAAAIHWTGDGPAPIVSDIPMLSSAAARTLRAGDGVVVSAADLAGLADVPSGSIGIVDLGERTDRAEIAAIVTLAIEFGAGGFISQAPLSVRRAAYVIRAVEHAR